MPIYYEWLLILPFRNVRNFSITAAAERTNPVKSDELTPFIIKCYADYLILKPNKPLLMQK